MKVQSCSCLQLMLESYSPWPVLSFVVSSRRGTSGPARAAAPAPAPGGTPARSPSWWTPSAAWRWSPSRASGSRSYWAARPPEPGQRMISTKSIHYSALCWWEMCRAYIFSPSGRRPGWTSWDILIAGAGWAVLCPSAASHSTWLWHCHRWIYFL